MTVHNLSLYHSDGRLRGVYVYMLLCQDDGPLYVKIGISRTPTKRVKQLWLGCPVTPRYFATVEVRSEQKAKKIERELLAAMGKWSQTGEWLRLSVDDKPEFNSKWKAVFSENVEPGWPLAWSQADVQALRADGQSKMNFARKLWRKRGRAYQDFARSQ
jgi:hypothetical protein